MILDNEGQRTSLIACVRQMAATMLNDASDACEARHAVLAQLRRSLESARIATSAPDNPETGTLDLASPRQS